MIVKKKKAKGRTRVSNLSQQDGKSIGSISNSNIDLKNIFAEGIRQKMVQAKKKKRVVN